MTADACHAVRYRYRGQRGAAPERITADARHAVRYGIFAAWISRGILYQRRCILVKQNAVNRTITWIGRINFYLTERAAAIERRTADARHAVPYRYRGQRGAAQERIIADVRHAVRYRYRGQRGAAVERRITDARHAVPYRYRGQRGAEVERIFADARHAVRYRYRCQRAAAIERPTADARHAVRYRYRGQRGAAIERSTADARHAVIDLNICDSITVTVPRHPSEIIICHIPFAGDYQFAGVFITLPHDRSSAGAGM